MGKPYPVPIRPHWRTLVEFRDGQHITGADDACLVDAWRRIHWLEPFDDDDVVADRARWKTRILEHATAIYGVDVSNVTGESTDTEWLDALDACGAITVIRK